MKKVFIASGIFGTLSILFIFIACVFSGFDIFELTNYNNYVRNEEYFENISILEINDSIVTKIDKHSEDKILVVYYTNDNSEYLLTKEYNKLNIDVYINDNTSYGSSLVFSTDKGVEIYLPQNSNIDININSEDCVLDIEDVIVNNIVINNEYGSINIEDVTCNSLDVTLNDGLINVEDVKCSNIEINIYEGIATIELPYEQSKYKLDIYAKKYCNVLSGGNGTNLLKVKSENGSIVILFN